MRLARELPNLSPADAQRVAELSLRDAISQLAQQARQLRSLPASAAVDALAEAEDTRLRDWLVDAANHQRRPLPPDAEAKWPTVAASAAAAEPPARRAHRGGNSRLIQMFLLLWDVIFSPGPSGSTWRSSSR
jgi:hypothetical protein